MLVHLTNSRNFINFAHCRKALWYSATGEQTTFFVGQRKMDDILETIYFDKLYFLQFTEDDITLSQICDAIEKEGELIDGMHEISFGNKFDMNSH